MSADGLTAAQLAEYRQALEARALSTKAIADGRVNAHRPCEREFYTGLAQGHQLDLDLLDELLADVVTFALADPDDQP